MISLRGITNHEHRESSYLRAYKAPVICRLSSVVCRLPSTSVENPLQIDLFMQNKPNLVRRRRILNELKLLVHKGL